MRIERTKSEIFEFELQRIQPEAFGERRVDVQRLARDGAPTFRRHAFDGAHVVQSIGELDEDDAQIAHHREQHLAEGFRLRFFTTLELNLIEFDYAIDDLGDGFTEAAC